MSFLARFGGSDKFGNRFILVFWYTLYWWSNLAQATTVKVSRETLEMLERLRDKLQAKSVDDAIRLLLIKNRARLIEEVFGIDKGAVKPFTEEDRGENRS